jgi:hypothetical protein
MNVLAALAIVWTLGHPSPKKTHLFLTLEPHANPFEVEVKPNPFKQETKPNPLTALEREKKNPFVGFWFPNRQASVTPSQKSKQEK